MKAIFLKIIFLMIGIYLLLILLVFFCQRSLMYFPQPPLSEETVQALLPKVQMIHVVTADGVSLKAYFMPPQDNHSPIILAFHGNGALGMHLSQNFTEAIGKGYGVLFAEYRGYSGNEGHPTEAGLYQDADAYLAYLKANYPETSIIAYGQSLGSGVAVDLVARNPHSFTGLMLEVPFDSALNVADRIYPYIVFKKWILRDQYLSNEKIESISIPKLFLLAGQDEVVGFDSGIKLFDTAKDPKQIRVYNDATHGTVFQYGAQIDMMDFLQSLPSFSDMK